MSALADPSMNAAERRADLELLLRSRKLDRTLTSALPIPDREDSRWLASTGIPDLDRQLGGGLPRGQLSELTGPRSSGRLAILYAALAAATARGEAVAVIDPLDMFDPPSAGSAGIDLARLLWVRGDALSSARTSLSCEHGTLQKAVDRALKSLNLVLQAGGFGLVALDLAEIAPQVVRRTPFTTWLRLQRVMEGGDTACVLVGSEPMARSSSGLTLALERASEGANQMLHARVIRARAMETGRDVCLRISAAAC